MLTHDDKVRLVNPPVGPRLVRNRQGYYPNAPAENRYPGEWRSINGVCLGCRLWPCCCETAPVLAGVYCGRPGCTSC